MAQSGQSPDSRGYASCYVAEHSRQDEMPSGGLVKPSQLRAGSGVDASAEFKRRRIETWRRTRAWLFAVLLAALPWLFVKSIEERASVTGLTALLGSLVVFLVAAIKISGVVSQNYRCPICNTVPMSGNFFFGSGGIGLEDDVDVAPKACRECGARLR